VLWELQDDQLIRFRCRVGHAYSPESYMATQSTGLEDALWAAFRALEERVSFLRRLAARSRDTGQIHATARFEE